MVKRNLKRHLDNIIKERLEMIGVIVIIGPKWCGKTTTAKQQAKSGLVYKILILLNSIKNYYLLNL